MSRVNAVEPSWRYILGINARFAGAVGMVWLGHVLWEARSVEWWGLGLGGLLLFAGGAAHGLRGVIDVIRLVLHQRRVKRFERQGVDAKADGTPSSDALRDRGMIR